jgi:hypothetical protein
MQRTVLKMLAATSVAVASLAVSTPAFAAAPPPAPSCDSFLSSFGPEAAVDCVGFFDGNLLNQNDNTAQENAVEQLGVDYTTFSDYLKLGALNGTTTIDFGQALIGEVVIGIHFGAAGVGGQGGATGFFLFDFDTPTTSITTTIQASSGVVLYQNGTPPSVPEPATWGMMLLGFGAAGAALRRSRRRTVALPQIA